LRSDGCAELFDESNEAGAAAAADP